MKGIRNLISMSHVMAIKKEDEHRRMLKLIMFYLNNGRYEDAKKLLRKEIGYDEIPQKESYRD